MIEIGDFVVRTRGHIGYPDLPPDAVGQVIDVIGNHLMVNYRMYRAAPMDHDSVVTARDANRKLNFDELTDEQKEKVVRLKINRALDLSE